MRAKDRRSLVVQIRFRPDDMERIKLHAKRAGKLYVSEWLRETVLQVLDTRSAEV